MKELFWTFLIGWSVFFAGFMMGYEMQGKRLFEKTVESKIDDGTDAAYFARKEQDAAKLRGGK